MYIRVWNGELRDSFICCVIQLNIEASQIAARYPHIRFIVDVCVCGFACSLHNFHYFPFAIKYMVHRLLHGLSWLCDCVCVFCVCIWQIQVQSRICIEINGDLFVFLHRFIKIKMSNIFKNYDSSQNWFVYIYPLISIFLRTVCFFLHDWSFERRLNWN